MICETCHLDPHRHACPRRDLSVQCLCEACRRAERERVDRITALEDDRGEIVPGVAVGARKRSRPKLQKTKEKKRP
jgi:hypothetical protein